MFICIWDVDGSKSLFTERTYLESYIRMKFLRDFLRLSISSLLEVKFVALADDVCSNYWDVVGFKSLFYRENLLRVSTFFMKLKDFLRPPFLFFYILTAIWISISCFRAIYSWFFCQTVICLSFNYSHIYVRVGYVVWKNSESSCCLSAWSLVTHEIGVK